MTNHNQDPMKSGSEWTYEDKIYIGGIVTTVGLFIVALSIKFLIEWATLFVEAGLLPGVPPILHVPAALGMTFGFLILVGSFLYFVGHVSEKVLRFLEP